MKLKCIIDNDKLKPVVFLGNSPALSFAVSITKINFKNGRRKNENPGIFSHISFYQ
jgi:hypothetical protein